MKALSGQSFLDLAVQSSGSASAAFDLAVKNGLSITDEPSGEIIAVDVINQTIANYYTAKGLTPASIGNMVVEDGIFTEQFNEAFA